MKYDHGTPQSLRVTLDCPNEYDAYEHDQELNGGAEGFRCVESTAEKHTSACMISKKLHRPAGAGSHRHRFRTTRIPPNARTRAPPPDIPRETLGSVFCYIPSMLGPSQGVLPFKSRRIGLHRARHGFVARTASQQEDGLRGPEQSAPQATDQVPRQTSEDPDPANSTARFTYPLRFARRIANDCYKLQRSGLARGPDQHGWTLTDAGTRQMAAEVTPALTTARGTALAQLHPALEKGFLEPRISVFIFEKKNKGSPRFLEENEVRSRKLSQPTTPTGTRPTHTRSNDLQRPQPDFNEPTRAPPRDSARSATKPACGLHTLTGPYRTRIAHLISGRRSFGKGRRTATLRARKSLRHPLSPPILKPLDAESSREAWTHRSEWHHGRRVGTSGPNICNDCAGYGGQKSTRTGWKLTLWLWCTIALSSHSLFVQLVERANVPTESLHDVNTAACTDPMHPIAVAGTFRAATSTAVAVKALDTRMAVNLPYPFVMLQRYSDERAEITSGSRAARSTTDTLGNFLKREQTAPASQSTTHGSRHAGKP